MERANVIGRRTVFMMLAIAIFSMLSVSVYGLSTGTTVYFNIADNTDPVTNLVIPDPGYQNRTATTMYVNFTCNATDNVGLASIHLYLTNSTNESFALNQTQAVAGSPNTVSWILALGPGNYTWNCIAYDTSANYDWAANRSLTINFSNEPPNVTNSWVSPAAPTSAESVTVYVNVTDVDPGQTMNCSLSGNLSGSATAATTGGEITISIPVGTLSVGNYSYNVTCDDSVDSDTDGWFNFTVTQAAAPPEPGGGGGGGGGALPPEEPEEPPEEPEPWVPPVPLLPPAPPVVPPEVPPAPPEEPALPGAPPAPSTPSPGRGLGGRPLIPVADIVRTEEAVTCSDEVEIVKHRYTSQDIMDLIVIPEGYEVIAQPFSAACYGGERFMVNLLTGDEYEDITVLKCSGDDCVSKSTTYTRRICEAENVCRVREDPDYRLNLAPVNISYAYAELDDEEVLSSGKYVVGFDTGVEASMSMPTEDQPQPKNKNVRIVGTPMLLTFSQEAVANVTLPYFLEEGDDEASVAIYAKTGEGEDVRWQYIGGQLNLIEKTITASVDLAQFADAGEGAGEIILAPITIYCPECGVAEFKERYTPTPDSRYAVVLVHGLWSATTVWDAFIDDFAMTNQPFQVWTFTYDESKSIEESAEDLALYMETNSYRYDTVYVVGYSLGGLIAQLALETAYEANQESYTYDFLEKVDKAIIVGTPNRGTPVIEEIGTFITEYVNSAEDFVPMHPVVKEALSEGIDVDPVPGIDYYSIAGTKPYDFMQRLGLDKRLFGDEENDGIVAVSSAQQFGDAVLDERCVNYWSSPVEHTRLNDDLYIYRLVGQIISSRMFSDALYQEVDVKLVGYANNLELWIEDCHPDDLYVVIGREVDVKRPAYCACGDGVCAGLEDESTCPEDCLFLQRAYNLLWLLILLLLLILFITGAYFIHQRYKKQESMPYLSAMVRHLLEGRPRREAKKKATEEFKKAERAEQAGEGREKTPEDISGVNKEIDKIVEELGVMRKEGFDGKVKWKRRKQQQERRGKG